MNLTKDKSLLADDIHPPLVHPRYRPDIDGLRGFAVLAVVGFHAFPGHIQGGYIGVDVFFVISGFLISSIIFESLAKDAFDFKTFYARRIKRIFPALILLLVGCYAFGWFSLAALPYSQLGKHIAAGAGFLSNIALLSEAGYFDSSSEMKPLLHLWSLGIEEQFYLVWPLLIYLAWKLRANLLVLTTALTLVSFALSIYIMRSDISAAFYLPFTRFWELGLGCILSYVVLYKTSSLHSIAQRLFPRITTERLANIRSFLGFVLLSLAIALLTSTSFFPGWWGLLPTIGTCLILSAGPEAWLNRRLLTNPVLVWFGLISFPLYLWHWPLLSFAQIVSFGPVATKVRVGLLLIACLLSWLTYRFVEKPIRFGGHSRAKVIGLSACMILIAGAGFLSYGLNGLPTRAINRNPKLIFLAHYQKLHDHGLDAIYHSECDFYDWDRKTRKRSIAASCTDVPVHQSAFLWGDSHAAALSAGLRNLFDGNPRLAQVTTSGCNPSITGGQSNTPADACDISNQYALQEVARLKPRIVILAQADEQEHTDWDSLATRLHSLGAGSVVLIGPDAQWLPSLPLVFVQNFWGKDPGYNNAGLDTRIFTTEMKLQSRYGRSTNLIYVSLLNGLCKNGGCLERVPNTQELMVVDYGHLSPLASVFVARTIIGEALQEHGVSFGPDLATR
ncbi:MAG TPA: acyltransferase family protein [Acidisarcina sp.]|nr:acyltransferase family protein [Acidisarcina sp.]